MLNGIRCSKVAEAVIDKSNLKSKKKKNETPFKTVKLTLYVLILRSVIIPLINLNFVDSELVFQIQCRYVT